VREVCAGLFTGSLRAVLASGSLLKASARVVHRSVPGVVADQSVCGDMAPSLECQYGCGRAGVEGACDRFRADAPAARRMLGENALESGDIISCGPGAQQGRRDRWQRSPGLGAYDAIGLQSRGFLRGPDG
jgi:hypothetical protein